MIKVLNKCLIVVFFIFFCFFSVLNVSFSATDLHIDHEIGYCTGEEAIFKLYNATQYENRDEINDDLCDLEYNCARNDCDLSGNINKDKCEECDRCLFFDEIRNARVKIYDGPLSSLPLIADMTTNASGHFEYMFAEQKNYLIEVTPDSKSGNYSDVKLVEFMTDCGLEDRYQNKTYEYLYGAVVFNIENTTSKGLEDFVAYNDVELMNELPGITDKYRFDINKVDIEYNKIDIIIKYPFTQKTKIYLLENNEWRDVNNFEFRNNSIILTGAEFGVYSIVEPVEILEEPVEELPQLENRSNDEIDVSVADQDLANDVDNVNQNLDSTQQENQEDVVNEVVSLEEEKSFIEENLSLIIFLIIVIVVGGGGMLYLKSKHQLIKDGAPHKEILTTYNQTLYATKTYIKQYKNEYSKDELYRALKESNVPSDVIDKAFDEVM